MSIGLGIAIASIWISVGMMGFAVKDKVFMLVNFDCPIIFPIISVAGMLTLMLTGV